ncbi:MAG: signal peptidase II [Oscillospiraceae bacterium]|nr:signal peptidase II [Oscillospiraceae bacterium]
MLILALLAAAAIAGADQLIKHWVMANMTLGEDREFLRIGSVDLFHLHYIENKGAIFSSFSGQRVLLLTVTTIGILLMLYLLIARSKGKPLLRICLTMILGGAVGNFIDRAFHGGSVVDYLDVQLFDFAVFNFADCFVTVGTVLLFLYILFFMDRQKPEAKDDSGSDA